MAASLSRTAQALRDALSRLRAIADDESSWSGSAANAFREAVREPTKSHIDQVPERYDGYASRLRFYASALDTAQLDVDSLRRRVLDAMSAYRVAEGAAASIGCAEQECQNAARQFQVRYNAWVDDANACINGLKSIDKHDKLHNPHGMYAAIGSVAGFMERVSSLSGVLALVSLVVCPELAVAFLAISTATTLVKFGADVGRAAYGDDVGWRALAFDALGSIPVAATARGAWTAAREVRAAETAAGKAGSAAKTFGRHVGQHYRTNLVAEPALAMRQLRESGGLAESAKAATWTRTATAIQDTNKQDVLGYPASYGNNAWDNHRHGWTRAIGMSALRVTWAPVDRLVPDGIERGARESVAPLGDLPAVLNGIDSP